MNTPSWRWDGAVSEVTMNIGIGAFFKDDKGAVTIEFVTLFLFAVFALMGFMDASILYLTRTEMFNTARDAARQVSVGALTVAEVPDYVNGKIMLAGRIYTLASYSGSLVIVEMTVNIGDASVFGIFGPVLGRTMGTRVEMLREATPAPPPLGVGAV